MRRRRLGDVRIAAAAIGEGVDELRDDGASTPDAMFLHQDRQDVSLLVEVGELLPEAEERLVGRRPASQLQPVDAGGSLATDTDRETQMRRGQRLEGQGIEDAAARAAERPGHACRAAGSTDRVDGRMLVTRRDRVANVIGAFRRAEGLDVRDGLFADQEIAVGLALPQQALRRPAMHDAQLQPGPPQNEVADWILFGGDGGWTGLRGKVARQGRQRHGRRASGGKEITALHAGILSSRRPENSPSATP